jgi:hypothetical protein
VACSGWRTPYPQKRQQTLGATPQPLWKTAESYDKSGFTRGSPLQIDKLIIFQSHSEQVRFIWPVADSEHLIHRSANRDWGQVLANEQTYPLEKALKNRNLGWLFFVRRLAGLDLYGV